MRYLSWLVFVNLILVPHQVAVAGMPSLTLTDVGHLRLSSISFFIMLILCSALGIRFLWNGVRGDFPRLPRISFRGALTGVLLWGLVFVVVLTMISGARELMTPGAWVKNGLTYQLAEQPVMSDPEYIASEVSRQLNQHVNRITRLQSIGAALREFADQNSGAWPTEETFREFPKELRFLPGDLEVEYLYRAADAGQDSILVLEPAVYGDGLQMALYRSGNVAPFRSDP